MRKLRRLAVLSAALMLACEAGAQTLDAGRAVLLEAGSLIPSEKSVPDDASFLLALGSALENEAQARGLAVSKADFGEGTPEPQEALQAAAVSGARWALVARASIEEDNRVVWRASIYDGQNGGLLGSDAFSSYAGLSALPLIDTSAKRAFTAAWLAKETENKPLPISWKLHLASQAEGAVISLGAGQGDGERLALGSVEGGGLTAPYLPFLPGTRALVSQSKPGYWPRSDSIKIGKSDSLIALPPLYKITKSAFSLDYGFGRLLGIEASYRYYPLPDALYLQAAEALWAAYDFLPGSSPVYHEEVRLGAAFSPFFSPNVPLRLSIGSGVSSIATYIPQQGFNPPYFFDFLIEPVFFTVELHFPERAFFVECRLPYSLGAASGLLGQGWVGLNGSAPLFTAGVLWKW
jgi:hypothetical protein